MAVDAIVLRLFSKSSVSLLAPDKEDPNLFSKEKGSDFLFLAACPAAQQKHPQRMAGLLQLRRSALRMLIFYAAPSLLMGESGYRLRFDVIFRNTPAFLAPLCRATVERSETERFYPTSCR